MNQEKNKLFEEVLLEVLYRLELQKKKQNILEELEDEKSMQFLGLKSFYESLERLYKETNTRKKWIDEELKQADKFWARSKDFKTIYWIIVWKDKRKTAGVKDNYSIEDGLITKLTNLDFIKISVDKMKTLLEKRGDSF